LRRQLLISALSLLLGAGVVPTVALAQSSTVIRSPAIGGGVTSSNPYGASPYGSETPAAAPTATPVTSGGGGGQIGRLEERINELEDLVRQLTGKVEVANFKAQQVAKQMERMQSDIEFRFKELQEGKGGGAAAPVAAAVPPAAAVPANGAPVLIPPRGAVAPGTNAAGAAGLAPGPTALGQTAATAPSAPAAPKDAQAAYDAAFAMAQKGDLDNAQAAFDDFLRTYPTHSLAGNARYWQGDILFTKKDFGGAAATFLEAYKKYPKHAKAPDMIYKAALSLAQLGKTREACSAFAILYKDHPDMPDRISRASTSERQRLGCN